MKRNHPDVAEILISADALQALGLNNEAEFDLIARAIAEANIGFLMAPRHHSAMRHVAGARVEVAPYKQDPADFILWKQSDDDLPGWDSPWGAAACSWGRCKTGTCRPSCCTAPSTTPARSPTVPTPTAAASYSSRSCPNRKGRWTTLRKKRWSGCTANSLPAIPCGRSISRPTPRSSAPFCENRSSTEHTTSKRPYAKIIVKRYIIVPLPS